MKAFTTAMMVFLMASAASACVWITGTKYNGDTVRGMGAAEARHLRWALEVDKRLDGLKMEAELRGSTNFNDRSDYSVALMFLGRSKEAVERLTQLEKEKPGQYFIAANLGTAYELSGNDDEALKWISEGIRRNPGSHEGTEWLHAKILEAKIAQQKDTNYFKNHSVLELQPEDIWRAKEITVDNRKFSPKEVADSIEYQLRERMQFVKPADPVVASLLFDYAAIEAATKNLESAKEILRMAEQYGYSHAKIQPLLELYDRRISWRKTKGYAFDALIGVGAIWLLWHLYKLKIFVISSKDLK